MTTLKKPYFYRVFLLFSLFCFFFFFLFVFSNIKMKKTKNAIFFLKTSFLITQNFAKTLFWHTVTLSVLQKKPKNTIKLGKTVKKKLGPVFNFKLGPVFDFKKGKSWTSFWLYSTHIYICLRVRNWTPAASFQGSLIEPPLSEASKTL